jgi:transcriptional regulator with XRE-family HTH domain
MRGDKTHIRNNIKKYRLKKKMSRRELAEAMGFSFYTLKAYELQQRQPGEERVNLLCGFFRCRPRHLLELNI